MDRALEQAGRWRAWELALESSGPLLAAGLVWSFASATLGRLGPSRPLSNAELWLILNLVAGMAAWAAGRQVWLAGDRRARTAAVVGLVAGVGSVLALGAITVRSLSSTCPAALVDVDRYAGLTDVLLCRVGGVIGNPALEGRIQRASWNGAAGPGLWVAIALVSVVCGSGLRGRRLRPTRGGHLLFALLERRPASGLKSVIGEPPVDGAVTACSNHTWWGATCGQMYSAAKVWEPGEWCRRCRLTFRPATTRVDLHVILPVTGDVALLNAMERVDSRSWRPGEAMPLRAPSVSGTARWVQVGSLALPDTVPVSQAIAIAHDMLALWEKAAVPEAVSAISYARARASRVMAWLWVGQVTDRLHLATPTRNLLLVSGGARLRDLLEGRGEELSLQLDVGLLPVEVRTAFQHTVISRDGEVGQILERAGVHFDQPGDPTCATITRNLSYVTWVTTRPEASPAEGPGTWVPRLEGAALRSWLAYERTAPTAEMPAGKSEPRPYCRYVEPRITDTLIVGVWASGEAYPLLERQIQEGARGRKVMVTNLRRPEQGDGGDVPLHEALGAAGAVHVVLFEPEAGGAPEGSVAEALRWMARDRSAPVRVIVFPLGAPGIVRSIDAWKKSGVARALRYPLSSGAVAQILEQARLGRVRGGARVVIEDASVDIPLEYRLLPLQGLVRFRNGPAEASLSADARLDPSHMQSFEPVGGADVPLGARLLEWDWFDLP